MILFLFNLFTLLSVSVYAGEVIYLSMNHRFVTPEYVALYSVESFFGLWSTPLLFLTIIAVIWNRESALLTATGGQAGKHNPVVLITGVVLALLLFSLGTAELAMYVQYLKDPFERSLARYTSVVQAFNSFEILTGVFILIAVVLLDRKTHKAAVADKVTAHA